MADSITRDFRYVEQFAVEDPKAWFRIMPVGTFTRFGRAIRITLAKISDMVTNFRAGIPDTTLPVNREHSDVDGRVGVIADLDARDDGLYARIDWNDDGLSALARGAFQYFSPEIIWETDYDGQIVENLLVGLAVTNSPYFGAATAMFSISDVVSGERSPAVPTDDEEVVMDERKLGEAIAEAFNRVFGKRADDGEQAAPPETPVITPEQYTAAVSEAAELKARFAALEAEVMRVNAEREAVEKAAARTARVEAFAARVPAAVAEILADLEAGQAERLAVEIAALHNQSTEAALFTEIGSGADGGGGEESPIEQFDALVADQVAAGVEKVAAIKAVARAYPNLYRAIRGLRTH